jgi:hypothetical protein
MSTALALIAEGRYALFFSGQPCGEERWRMERVGDGVVATGEQVMEAPHPFPNRHEYRIALTDGWRVTGLDIVWSVGARRVSATHRATGARWHARLEADGHTREQQGDYPPGCEVEYCTHLSNTFILAQRDFGLNGEHEFPVLRIGPPLMAVTPGRMLFRCHEIGERAGAPGRAPFKRYALSLPPAPEDEGYTFWADADDVVIESYEGLDPTRPWMRLVEYRRGPAG